MAQVQSKIADDAASLTEAFHAFNALSEQLTTAYDGLQQQVAELSSQLSDSQQQRRQEQAQKERLADRLSGLLEALPAAVVLVDGRDRIDRFNPAAESLFPGLAWGRRWSEVRDEQLCEVLASGEWLLRNGYRINVSTQPLTDNGQILVLLDVTEQRELEQRLERQQRLSAMGRMSAQLAHQIRTPLSSALLYGGHLKRAGLSEEQRRAFADKLLDGLRHTEKLISDMLAFSRGGNLQARSVDPCRVMELAIDSVAPRLVDVAQIRYHCDMPEGVALVGNQEALIGAVTNLLENAVNHGGDKVGIWIDVGSSEQGLHIVVEDDGPGIEPALRDRVFDPFFTTRERGTGLGLAVVQAVILEHGGRVSASTPTHGGARFDIELPLMANNDNNGSRQ